MRTQRQLFLQLFALIILLSLTNATPFLLENKTYTNGNQLSIDRFTYTIYVGAENTTTIKILEEETATPFFLDEKECKTFVKTRVCYEQKEDPTNVRITTYDLNARINLTLTLNDTSKTYEQGTLIDAELLFLNDGDTATPFNLTLPLPENISLIDTKECSYDETTNLITWEGTLEADEDEHCELELRIDGNIDDELQATATYLAADEQLNVTSEEIPLKATTPLTINLTITDHLHLEPGQPITINYNLSTDKKDLTISINPLTLTYDPTITLISATPSLRRNKTRTYTRTNDINITESFAGTIKLAPNDLNAEGTITLYFTYNTSKETTPRTITKTYTYSTDKKDLIITTNPKELSFEALTSGDYDIVVTNPYHYFPFKGYDVVIIDPLTHQRYTEHVPYQQRRIVATIHYDLPDSTTKQEKNIKVTITAVTHDGQRTTNTADIPFIIHPLQSLTITKTAIPSNSSTNITLIATNNHQEPITVHFSEQLPANLFTKGKTATTITLQPRQPTTIYQYDILSPDIDGKQTITTTTIYNYTYNGKPISRRQQQPVTLAPLVKQVKTVEPSPSSEPAEQENIALTPIDNPNELRQRPALIHIIIATSILLIFVIILLIRDYIIRFHVDKIQRRSIIQKYKLLLTKKQQLKDEEQAIKREQQNLRHKLITLQHHLTSFEHHIPEELSSFEQQKKELLTTQQHLHDQEQALQDQIKQLQEQNNHLQQKEEQLNTTINAINKEEQTLKQDDELLNKDLQQLKDEEQELQRRLKENIHQQHALHDRISHFKRKHALHLKSKIHLLTNKKNLLKQAHEELEKEEQRVKEEYEHMQRDLQFSEQEQENAEKLFKEAKTQISHDEQQP